MVSSQEVRTASATTSVNSSGYATTSVTLTADTTVGSTAVLSAVYLTTPKVNSTAGVTNTLTTVAGSFSKIAIKTFFDSAQANSASTIEILGTLYIDACLADAYNNPLTVTGIVQISLASSSGLLSPTPLS